MTWLKYEKSEKRRSCSHCGELIYTRQRILRIGEELVIHEKCGEDFAHDLLKSRPPSELEPIWKEHDKKLRVLDLCSGLKGWTEAFVQRGHDVLTIDADPETNPDICADVCDITTEKIGRNWDLILASPPCQAFSVMSCYHHWTSTEPRVAKTEKAEKALQIVHHIWDLIEEIDPTFWFIENPQAMMRKLWKLPNQVTYFSSWSGSDNKERRPKKTTDIWCKAPASMPWPEPRRWEIAPRGENRGLQGQPKGLRRAKIPWGLSFTVCIHAEAEILGGKRPVKPMKSPPDERWTQTVFSLEGTFGAIKKALMVP